MGSSLVRRSRAPSSSCPLPWHTVAGSPRPWLPGGSAHTLSGREAAYAEAYANAGDFRCRNRRARLQRAWAGATSPAPLPPMSSTTPLLTVRLFGPFSAWVAGSPLPRLRSRKGQWLLALLLLRDRREVDRG